MHLYEPSWSRLTATAPQGQERKKPRMQAVLSTSSERRYQCGRRLLLARPPALTGTFTLWLSVPLFRTTLGLTTVLRASPKFPGLAQLCGRGPVRPARAEIRR